MNNILTTITLICFFATSVNCSSSGPRMPTMRESLLLLELGNTKPQVRNALGVPIDRSFSGTNEAWSYCDEELGRAFSTNFYYATAWFSGDSLVALTTNSTRHNLGEALMPSCDIVPAVDWGQLPDDVSILLKNR